MEEQNKLINLFLNKSIDAFMLAIEIYNKPTITYRLDSFIILLSNSWDNALKAKIIQDIGEEKIYYKNNKYKTLSIAKLLDRVYNNKKNPVYQNINFIIKLRNTASHFVIPELNDELYPIFQANINNYIEFMEDFFDIDITEKFNFKFMSFIINSNEINENKMINTYGKTINEHFKKLIFNTVKEIKNNGNSKFANNININLLLTKSKGDADISAYIDNTNSTTGISIVKEVKDINNYYPLTVTKVTTKISKRLIKENINIDFNTFKLNLIVDEYSLREDKNYYYFHENSKRWNCSNNLVTFVFEIIKANPKIIDELKLKKRQNKKEDKN